MRRPRGIDETQRAIAATFGIGLMLGAIAWASTVSIVASDSLAVRIAPPVGMFVVGAILAATLFERGVTVPATAGQPVLAH